MEAIYIAIGLALGLSIGYIIHLKSKSNLVAKAELDAVTKQLNDMNTSLSLSEEKRQNCLETINSNTEEILRYKSDINQLYQELRESENNLTQQKATEKALKDKLAELQNEYEEQKTVLKEYSAQTTSQIKQISELTENSKFLKERLETQKEDIIELQKTAQLNFEKIANQILEEKTAKFTESNKSSLETLLKPLGENIEKFKKQVEETYDKESKERFSLGEKVKDLIEQTNKVSDEANNLATALKGQGKKQGNWGEIILESILERSGLVKNREYYVQPTIKDEGGKNLRPDILVYLPDKRVVIIDSKVSLVAYDKFSACENSDEQALCLAEHMKSIRNHIDDLHQKKYDDLETSLDFTMMFIPIEPAYLLAIQSDAELWTYAYTKRILLISPTNLIACLKLIADLWKREMQSKNAMEIVRRGELMYDKFVGFTNTIQDLEKHINNTQTSFDKAMRQLSRGPGNLITQAQLLKNLGLKSSKNVPENMISHEELNTELGISEPSEIEQQTVNNSQC